jgi:hypothetical protein
VAQDYENVKMARATEQPAVRTTIVGGRPPGSGQPVGDIPRGMEVLVKKAAVDAGFRDVLLSRRAAAADLIGLTLDKTEAAMLAAIPAAQLEAIVGATRVPTKLHAVFMGAAAAAMLAALGAGAARAEDDRPYAGGAAPDEPTPVYPVAGIAPMSDDEMWLMNLKAPGPGSLPPSTGRRWRPRGSKSSGRRWSQPPTRTAATSSNASPRAR